jgi:8-hydroxy-5-deazaflavin:NADPH oxidoreductase
MKIGILGTGMVGLTLGSALVAKGHSVKVGARQAGKQEAVDWAKKEASLASQGSFSDAASYGELLINATKGEASIKALEAAGAGHLDGKTLMDISNPLDFSKGMPPSLLVSNTDSLGEQIQRAFPKAKVVKTLNTLNCILMVHPERLAGPHNIFMSGNDAGAKQQTLALLTGAFGWKPEQVLDLGPLASARGTESLLLLWAMLYGGLGHANFNFHMNIGPKG